jgi:hypothetical protein
MLGMHHPSPLVPPNRLTVQKRPLTNQAGKTGGMKDSFSSLHLFCPDYFFTNPATGFQFPVGEVSTVTCRKAGNREGIIPALNPQGYPVVLKINQFALRSVSTCGGPYAGRNEVCPKKHS